MGEVISFPVSPRKGKIRDTATGEEKNDEVLRHFKLTLSSRQKREFSHYFYNMLEECVVLISKRELNTPYGLGLPREAIKQFTKERVKLLQLLKKNKAAPDLRRVLSEAGPLTAFLQGKLGRLSFIPFPYSPEMAELFKETNSLLMSLERTLNPVLICPQTSAAETH